MEIKTWRDPYDAGFSPTRPTKIDLKEGLTVLVGCNGAGKSTLLLNINDEMCKNKIPCNLYDNLKDGGSNSLGTAFMDGDTSLGVALFSASEGESIKINVGNLSNLFDDFLETGFINTRRNRIARLFKDDEVVDTNIRVLLFDAIDSGLSVDSVVEVKRMCEKLLEKSEELDKKLYIIISANEYELARNSECFDVNSGTYLRFKDYEDYRSFIIKTRRDKEKRIEKQAIWYNKKREHELKKYNRLVERNTAKIQYIKDKASDRNLTWSEKNRIHNLEREINQNKPAE